jgi:hypothetical protein
LGSILSRELLVATGMSAIVGTPRTVGTLRAAGTPAGTTATAGRQQKQRQLVNRVNPSSMVVNNSRNSRKVSNNRNTILTIENKTINLQKDIRPRKKAFLRPQFHRLIT